VDKSVYEVTVHDILQAKVSDTSSHEELEDEHEGHYGDVGDDGSEDDEDDDDRQDDQFGADEVHINIHVIQKRKQIRHKYRFECCDMSVLCRRYSE
jgi:hypothetical protein